MASNVSHGSPQPLSQKQRVDGSCQPLNRCTTESNVSTQPQQRAAQMLQTMSCDLPPLSSHPTRRVFPSSPSAVEEGRTTGRSKPSGLPCEPESQVVDSQVAEAKIEPSTEQNVPPVLALTTPLFSKRRQSPLIVNLRKLFKTILFLSSLSIG